MSVSHINLRISIYFWEIHKPTPNFSRSLKIHCVVRCLLPLLLHKFVFSFFFSFAFTIPLCHDQFNNGFEQRLQISLTLTNSFIVLLSIVFLITKRLLQIFQNFYASCTLLVFLALLPLNLRFLPRLSFLWPWLLVLLYLSLQKPCSFICRLCSHPICTGLLPSLTPSLSLFRNSNFFFVLYFFYAKFNELWIKGIIHFFRTAIFLYNSIRLCHC